MKALAASLVLFIPLSAFADALDVPIQISGGHDTDPRDHGRPVALVAGALGVPQQVFRDAFSHVRPAPAGEAPSGDRVRANKEQLLSRLAPYGVTNDRLDEVSNQYRYDPRSGVLWPNRSAKLVAHIVNGKLTEVRVVDGGAGYTSAPTLSLPGFGELNYRVKLAFGADFDRNGSIQSVSFAHK